ncbi:S1 family peptidase [Paraliomyxa miuraensis]|uniref:S1 family peptidase n=1 Tax=Paraliomyxa miuraensis TaxID=376150 RepID=UPI0022534513|nr:S1 family peptidase [Paraliomyxa miuraensis]MCX4240898.1 S1 family peptidase [Paraliomyxa miuraensis]
MARFTLPFTTAWCPLLLVAGLATACDGLEDGRNGDQWAGAESAEDDGEDAPAELPDGIPGNSEIYGGTDVVACGWPTTVSLGGSCSGTLVHERVVIYAAHCGANYSSVRLGESINGGPGRSVATEQCKIYPGGEPGEGNDFAYCTLKEPVNDVPLVPVLMGCEAEDYLVPNQQVTVVGFGNANTGPYGIKRQVTTKINSITANDEAFIGGGGKDSCQGDSGGPVFVQVEDGSWRVFGITSYGGACGTGGYYSMMHLGMAWFEQQTGYDLTPCHDADGTWNPGPDCRSFPLTPGTGTGTWANGCSGGAATGYSAACGAPYADDGGGGGGGDGGAGGDGGGGGGGAGDGVCPTCDRYTGSLSGAQDYDYQPDGNYYYARAGEHRAFLSAGSGTDFDLRLWKWSNGGWQTVQSSLGYTSEEQITYSGGEGYYVWRVESYSGSGSYELLLDTPEG